MIDSTINFSTISCYNSTKNPKDATEPKGVFISTMERACKLAPTTKENTPCFIAAHFNNQSRSEANIKEITLLVLDVDNNNKSITSINDLNSVLNDNIKEYDYFYYTTNRSTENVPRARIIIFLKETIQKEKYKNAVQNFIDTFTSTFKAALDIPSTMTINRLWFMPYKTSAEQEIHYRRNIGTPLNLTAYYDETLKQQEEAKPQEEQTLLTLIKAQPLNLTKEQIKEDLKKYPASNLDNNSWFEALAAIHHQFAQAEEGLKIANYWSSLDQRPNQYKGLEEITKIWHRLSTSKSNLVTWATIKMRIATLNPKEEQNQEQTQVHFNSIKLEKIHPALFPEPNMYFTDDGKPKYKPKCSVNNSNFLFDYYGIKLRNNLISKDIEGFYQGELITDIEILSAHVIGMFETNDFPAKHAKLFMSCNAKLNPYNPFKEFVLSTPWDNQDRLPQLFDTIKVDPQHIKIRDIYLKHWLLEIMKLTCFNDGEPAQFTKSILIFQSEEYSLKKTEWFRYLFPPKYIGRFFRAGALLKLNDHMSKLACLSKVVCELGETGQTLRKQDIDSLKSFISDGEDLINRKYGISHQQCRRMTVFCGTTNDVTFLEDKQGYGRFLVLPIKGCDAHHGIDMQQIYAQLYKIYEKEGWYEFNEEETNLKHITNSSFVYDCHIENMILKSFDFDNKDRSLRINCSEISDILNLPPELTIRNKTILNKIGRACRKHNIYKCSHTNKFYMPPIKGKVEF